MDIREYLDINQNYFTIYNESIYIHYNKGNNFILNLITKERFNNLFIPSKKNSLARIINIPLTLTHNLLLHHDNKLIYKEKIKSNIQFIEPDYAIWFPINERKIEHKLEYYINEEETNYFTIARSEKLDNNLKPYGKSKTLFQLRSFRADIFQMDYLDHVHHIYPYLIDYPEQLGRERIGMVERRNNNPIEPINFYQTNINEMLTRLNTRFLDQIVEIQEPNDEQKLLS